MLFDLCFLSTWLPSEKSKAPHIYDFLAFYRLRNRFFALPRGRMYIYVIYEGSYLQNIFCRRENEFKEKALPLKDIYVHI